jgi:hypothetical protein
MATTICRANHTSSGFLYFKDRHFSTIPPNASPVEITVSARTHHPIHSGHDVLDLYPIHPVVRVSGYGLRPCMWVWVDST